jgi:periplasmic divalent cation tolerance protein
MTDFIEVHFTSGSLDEARKVSRYLVQERYVASAQIIPWFESIYLLNNELDTSQESKVILKTTFYHFDKIKEVIEKNNKYEIPEITWFKIEGGNESYLKWLEESIKVLQETTKTQ